MACDIFKATKLDMKLNLIMKLYLKQSLSAGFDFVGHFVYLLLGGLGDN